MASSKGTLTQKVRYAMGRPSKKTLRSRRNGGRGGAVNKVTTAARNAAKSEDPATLRAPNVFSVDRLTTARQVHHQARLAWKFVVAHFDDMHLDHTPGNFLDCEQSYGGINAMMDFPACNDGGQHGNAFVGSDSYQKKGKTKNHIGKEATKHKALLRAIFESTVTTVDMVLIEPRIGLFRGVSTGYHTDANPRGAHPNAVRPLAKGFGLHLYMGVDFRCSLVEWKGKYVIPLDLNPVHFRWIQWQEDGTATIEVDKASVFWEVWVKEPEINVVGSIGCSVISMRGGYPTTCPLDYKDIRAHNDDLDPLTFSQALATAKANPIQPPTELWKTVGEDPGQWDVFFGWKHAHASFGDPWVRRIHVFGCPLRQNGSGQNREAMVDGDRGRKVKPMCPVREKILGLKSGSPVWVKGEWGEVESVEDALDARDMRVHVRYKDGSLRVEHLGNREWEWGCIEVSSGDICSIPFGK